MKVLACYLKIIVARNHLFWEHRFGYGVGTAIFFSLIGCGGHAQFRGGSTVKASDATATTAPQPPENPPTNPQPVPPNPVPPKAETPIPEPEIVAKQGFSDVSWFWPCVTEPSTAEPPTKEGELAIRGQGSHTVNYAGQVPESITFRLSGALCAPTKMLRDIVFAIDTSGSMVDNDPRIVDSCARLQALQSLVTSLTAAANSTNNARFGVVTFSSSVLTYSTGLYGSPTKMFADLAKSGKPADVLCAAEGATNYVSALTQAAAILSTGRTNATKEIYFVSDGEPTTGQDGISLADSLKSTGVTVSGAQPIKVTIATMMLKGVDTVLEKSIASKSPEGKPLHAYVSNTADLAQALDSLAESHVISAKLTYQLTANNQGSQSSNLPKPPAPVTPITPITPITVDMMPYLKQQLDFTLPPFSVPMTKDSAGDYAAVAITFESVDNHGNLTKDTGTLQLQ